MSKDNVNPEIWRYFKNGDIVRDSDDSCWGRTKFVIRSFHGNAYCPLVSAKAMKLYKGRDLICNLDVRDLKLIGSRIRPFSNIKKSTLLKLMKSGNSEARREFMIRINTKTL